MSDKSVIHRYLDPSETLGEVLFGLIMVLTITLGARLISAKEGLDSHGIVVAALGCNIAWGVIDAVLMVLGRRFHRSRRARFFGTLRRASSEAEALAAVREEFELEDEPLAIGAEDSARLHRAILALGARAAPAHAGPRLQDLYAALVICVLVPATAVPAVIPFLLLHNPNLALRISNLVLVLLLFLVGYWWAHYTDSSPWRVGLTVMLLGMALVGVAVALGG